MEDKTVHRFSPKILRYIILGIIFFGIAGAVIVSIFYLPNSSADKKLLESATSHPDMVAKVRILAKQKGARYVYSLLRNISVPKTVNKHTLGHVVGDILYRQEGLKGLTACVFEYRNACVHAVIANAMTTGGNQVLNDLAAVCRKKEVTPIDMPSCFHGIGHGLLAYTDYNLSSSLELCKHINPGDQGSLEFRECLGGVFMEFVMDDSHDRMLQQRAQEKYLILPDTLYPCASGMDTVEEKKACYHYLPPFLMMKASGTVGSLRLSPQILSTAMGFCNKVADISDQKICLRGFGTQFLLSGVNEDVKIISSVEVDRFRRVIEQCKFAPSAFGVRACIAGAIETILWGGGKEIPSEEAAIGLCQMIDDKQIKAGCFLDTLDTYFIRPKTFLSQSFCNRFPQLYQKQCQSAYQKN